MALLKISMPRRTIGLILCFGIVVLLLNLTSLSGAETSSTLHWLKSAPEHGSTSPQPSPKHDDTFRWQDLPVHYPVTSLRPLPDGPPARIPTIQHAATSEDDNAKATRLKRLAAVKEAFQHAWRGYKQHAWAADEVGPLSGARHVSFGGWAATLVDALDTLWIMDMKDEFEEAVQAVSQIDFTTTTQTTLNTFETTIRYLGGLLSAYDLSNARYPILLSKAIELGEMLLVSFDTPNRMPITRWDWQVARAGHWQQADEMVLLAELGSMTLEFTRLSQLTGDGRFYDAVQRVVDELEQQQLRMKLPGLWPIVVNARTLDFTAHNSFSIGAMADSTYEYLPKQHLLLGGRTEQYRNLYLNAATAFTKYNLYRPMTKENADILFSAVVHVSGAESGPSHDSSMQHLACFAGGMVAMGAKIFDHAEHLDVAQKLTDGCVWAYQSMANGLMAEVTHHVACPSQTPQGCEWNETLWHEELLNDDPVTNRVSSGSTASNEARVNALIHARRLPPGYVAIADKRYILRPEAIESVFIWYRITGDRTYQDKAWTMFENIEKHTRTEIANAALDDVTATPPTKADRMESFWMAETLKYFYLTFAEVDVVSLDGFVFNTEAHPLRRPSG